MLLISYTCLKTHEKRIIENTINQILGSSAISNILENKQLISIDGNRKEVYLINESDLALLDQISMPSLEKSCTLVHARIKLGFFIRDAFYIGIESLSLLAPHALKKVLLNKRETRNFIYGKDIDVTRKSLLEQIKKFKKNEVIIAFSNENLPVGFTKIVFEEKNIILHNLIDIGIYLRSEKSAF